MMRVSVIAGMAGALSLAACAVPAPPGPSVAVLPGDGKPLAQFQQDDGACRQYASQSIGNVSPQAAANQSAVGSAVVGTALGAAAGALIGAAAHNPGAGAAIGAGTGLLVGSSAGAGNAYASGAGLQHRYDVTYMQCMAARGDKVPVGPAVAAAYPAYGPVAYPAYPYPYPYYPYYPYPYYGPVVRVGFGFGWHRW